MLKRVAREEADVLPLPGRDWHTYIGPHNTATERVSMGVSVFEPGARPAGHVHASQEETIYGAAGRGRIVTPDGAPVAAITGTAIYWNWHPDAAQVLDIVARSRDRCLQD